MEKGNFNDRPDAARLALSIGEVHSDIDADTVLQFLNFQWSYREMQRQYDAVLTKYQLTESRFVILMFLYEAPKQQLLPLQLADKLGTTRATVSKLLRGLVTQGRVTKQASPTDKRAALISLTAEGERVLLSFLPHNFDAVQTLFGNLTSAELTTFSHLLAKINQGTQTLKNEMEN
ncbi:MarR family winged helix-turn-helix transcriptional regulator [Secundilactobacillus silagei]|uniref:MarR family transcriptional regulator n=1 Tax=Secundilactobacillus silagei JCM 19001 TaxID=1302250 RepID=A0A1Z5IJ79_9LACO|nr:MarR family transcriptional regulator [Secundilactobacillus silagei]TDG73104.1 hypothetical protein C5L25_000745 [Secundilactobacillus silagei JCM 19001]GAX01491.1 MarR family transcriptional regulator [Secundilactobacillus silagei JCM 19001]